MGSGADKSYYLILNPASNGGGSKNLFGDIHRTFKGYGLTYEYATTKTLNDAEQISRHANEQGFDVIVAVGGDGTINRVINGFYDNSGSRNSKSKLGVIYTGTSPDFCLSHNLPIRDVAKAVKALADLHTKPIGIGKINFASESRYFACCMNIGFGAGLAQRANSGIRAKAGDKLGTFVSLIKELTHLKRYSLSVNGVKIDNVINLSVGKTYYVASGLKVKNSLLPEDDRLYSLCIKDNIFKNVLGLYRGSQLPLDYLKKIHIEGTAPVEFDGDAYSHLPCTVSSAPCLEVVYEGI